MVRFSPTSLPPLSRQQARLATHWKTEKERKGGGGGRGAETIRQQESMVLYKSFSMLYFNPCILFKLASFLSVTGYSVISINLCRKVSMPVSGYPRPLSPISWISWSRMPRPTGQLNSAHFTLRTESLT
jgi:hypothetical protein